MIIKTNLNDLRDVTHNIHYENYRYKKLSSSNGNETKNGKTFPTLSINKFVLQFDFFICLFIIFLIEIYYLN